MMNNIYIMDTSSLLDLFKNHPPDIYTHFWDSLNTHFDALIHEKLLILCDFVEDEVIHTTGKREGGYDDPVVMWLKQRNNVILPLSDDVLLLDMAKEILTRFPQSADIDTYPPDADPYLIAYAKRAKNQKSLLPPEWNFVVVTQESRNRDQDEKKIAMYRQQKSPVVQLTKIRSICDYYKIQSMNYVGMFRTENWEF